MWNHAGSGLENKEMKRIGLLSDTHSCFDDRFAEYFSGCDEIWHAGDIGDIDVLLRLRDIAPVRAVCGNIDGAVLRRECREVECFTVEGVKVWMTHICGYPGKYSPGVRKILIEEKPQLVIAGHSHILRVMYDQALSLLLVNPGAAGFQGWHKVRTLVRFVIDGSEIRDLEVIELAPRVCSLG